MQTIGDRIKARRESLSLSLHEIHDQTGLSTNSIIDLENNNSSLPSLTTLITLARILDCSLDWLATGKEYGAESESLILSRREARLVAMFRAVTDDDQDDIYFLSEREAARRIAKK